MRPQSILGFIIWMTATVNASSALPTMYKIGTLMETGTSPVNTALRYEIDRHNNSTQWIFKFGLSIKGQGGLSNSYDITKKLCRILGEGVLIVYGMTDTSTINVIESYVETMKMPFVTPSAPHKISQSSPNSYIIYMRPFYGGAVVDIVKHYKWSKVYYIYDSEAGLLRLQDMYDHSSRSDNGLVIDAQRLTVVSHAYDILRHIDEQSEDKDKYIILDLSSEKSLQTVLRQVQNLGMNRAKYHYLLGTLAMDELDLRDFKYGGVNITGFRLIDTDNRRAIEAERIWRKLNASGANGKLQLDVALTIDSIAVLETAMAQLSPFTRRGNLRKCPCKVGDGCEHGASLLSKLKEMPAILSEGSLVLVMDNYIYNNLYFYGLVDVTGVTGRVAFDRHGHRTKYKLDIMEMSYNTDPKKIGTWDTERGVTMLRYNNTSPRGKHKEGNKTRIVTSILVKPYLMLKDKPEDGKPLLGNDMYEGYCADLVREVAKIVGFDYVIKPVADGAYGAKQDDKTWNGMVGELTTEKADLAVAPLTIASSRERVIDFSKPFMSLGISIMIKKPEKQKPGVFSFMDPLSNEIWACIIVSFVAVSLVLFLVSRFSPYEWQIEDSVNGPTFTNDFTILNSLWFSLAAFMQQGCDISPRSLSGRIVGSVWWFFTLIIISSYTANLAAFLTVERMLTPIESVDDLAKQTEIKYGTVNNGSTKEFFKSSQISVYVKMWQYMSSNPGVFVDTVQEGVDKVRTAKGKYAFLLESTMNDYYNQRKPCNTMKVGSNLDSKGYGIATPLKSDLRDPINLAVLQLRENGELQKLKKTWWYDKGECGVDAQGKDSKQSSLSLSNVAGIFYILIGGLGMSMVVSLLEFMYKSKTEGRRRRAMFRPASRVGESLTFQPGPVGENGGVGYTDGADQYKALSTVPIARSSAVSLV